MADITYQQARKIGLKEVKMKTARHEDPYLPALEELLPHMNSLNEVALGSIRIDIDQVVGTRSAARRVCLPLPPRPRRARWITCPSRG